MPVWTRLNKDAKPGTPIITVDNAAVAGNWPVGSLIAVTSSDYDRFQTEIFNIKAVIPQAPNTTLFLNKPCFYGHYGAPKTLSDGFGGYVDERSEVILISRNIVIMGTDEPAFPLEGGHFIVFMTNWPPQVIEGVQFYQMGQQGTLGRYSLHFHVAGSIPQTIVRKNSIYKSKQRGIVVHATHNLTVDSNTAVDTSGHCFMIEEGGEQNNTFINNIGVLTKAVNKTISPDETDNLPSTFWITNGLNRYIGNVAAGSKHSGFWFEFRVAVRGLSLGIPALRKIIPQFTAIKHFINNVAHSNEEFGLTTYPPGLHGYDAATDSFTDTSIITGLFVWKNPQLGAFIHDNSYTVLDGATFADNMWGVKMSQNAETKIINSRFVGVTNNYGNPTLCNTNLYYANCKPASTTSCAMPLAPGVPGRAVGFQDPKTPVLGIMIDQNRRSTGPEPQEFRNITFAHFDNKCVQSAAFYTYAHNQGYLWMPAHNAAGIRFSPDTNRIYMPSVFDPINKYILVLQEMQARGGEYDPWLTFFDKDGSISGKPGYIVANNPHILPVKYSSVCTFHSNWNAYACPGTCYRSVSIFYYEPGFTQSSKNAHGQYSYIKVTREADGNVMILDGNLNHTIPYEQYGRFYAMVLLASQTYRIEVFAGTKLPSFVATNISTQYNDEDVCGGVITLRFKQTPNKPWITTSTDNVFFKQCPTSIPFAKNVAYATLGPVCITAQPWLEVVMYSGFTATLPLWKGQGTDNGKCSSISECSMVWSAASNWLYDDSGLERHPAFFSPALQYPADWKTGVAPLGWYPPLAWVNTQVAIPGKGHVTYYYRRNFNIVNSGCYSSLHVDIVLEDGAAVYLNGKELFRFGLPSGPLFTYTEGIANLPWRMWRTFTIPLSKTSPYSLVEGTNVLAVEEHVYGPVATALGFDIRISAITDSSCKTATSTVEICDGLDNNGDGLVDKYPNGTRLTAPCSTPCGKGVATCINGQYTACTAKVATPEVCNGIDDDCNGLIDDSFAQLNCAAGSVCSQGKCLPVMNVTKNTLVWPQNSSGWSYWDEGGDMNSWNPGWKKGSYLELFSGPGRAPLGFDDFPRSPDRLWEWLGTTINHFTADKQSKTAYFVKKFDLTAAQVASTYNLALSVRRTHGAVIYLNGVELWRTNMNWGSVAYDTPAASVAQPYKEPVPGCCNVQYRYYPCDRCFYRNTSLPLKAGTNYVAAELHAYYQSEGNAAFDMDFSRGVKTDCSSLPGAPKQCTRQTSNPIILPNTVWKYSDATLALPNPATWLLPSFDDSQWKSGPSPLGYTSVTTPTIIVTKITGKNTAESSPRTTVYFRRTFNLADALCYHQFAFKFFATDGGVLYVNGVDVYRWNMPSTTIGPDTFTVNPGAWIYTTKQTGGGWFKKGSNTIAVELHRYKTSSTLMFDLQVTGWREALNCAPLPT